MMSEILLVILCILGLLFSSASFFLGFTLGFTIAKESPDVKLRDLFEVVDDE